MSDKCNPLFELITALTGSALGVSMPSWTGTGNPFIRVYRPEHVCTVTLMHEDERACGADRFEITNPQECERAGAETVEDAVELIVGYIERGA